MNKTVYLEMSIIEVSKTVMYQFFYDHVNPKSEKNETQSVSLYT